MTTPIHRGKVTQGKMILDNQSRFLVCLSRLEGKEIEVTVRKKKAQRSLEQNKAYWGIAVEILSDHLGYERDETHDLLRAKFLSRVDDKGLMIIRSTTSLSTVEFMEYYEKIQRWAASFLNCYIPSPGECDYSEVMP
jgi:hypothetical protein